MTTPQQEPDVVLTVERGKPMHFECVRAVWGYGQYDLYAAPPADEAVRLLKRARWFVKQENDACIVACAEDPDHCCADTLTAIDTYLAKVGK